MFRCQTSSVWSIINHESSYKRLKTIEFYYQNAYSVNEVHRALLPFYSQFNRPTEEATRAIVTNFAFTLLDIKPPTHLRRVRTEEIIAAVPSVIASSPFAVIGSLLLNNMHNFVERFRCEAFQNTAGARIEAEHPTATKIFVEWAFGQLIEDLLLYRKIMFSDEACFWLNT